MCATIDQTTIIAIHMNETIYKYSIAHNYFPMQTVDCLVEKMYKGMSSPEKCYTDMKIYFD